MFKAGLLNLDSELEKKKYALFFYTLVAYYILMLLIYSLGPSWLWQVLEILMMYLN